MCQKENWLSEGCTVPATGPGSYHEITNTLSLPLIAGNLMRQGKGGESMNPAVVSPGRDSQRGPLSPCEVEKVPQLLGTSVCSSVKWELS